MGKRQFFGTDGIRGRANTDNMTAELAIKLGMAAGSYFQKNSSHKKVVIAKDTRLSGYMLEPALTAGFIAVGMDVILVGPMPTPAVAMLTSSMRADLGVMLSASHNPHHDNGIKLFDPRGNKLSDDAEIEIERLMQVDPALLRVDAANLGRAKRIEDASGRYIELIKRTFPAHLRLDGLRIVLDCANGAAYKVAPIILQELGAEVITLNNEPDGFNINSDCGSTHPAHLIDTVKEYRADAGIALDGDADRIVMCDEQGALLDGDQILAMVAVFMKSRGKLKNDKVVATHMSNLAFEHYLNGQGISVVRTNVGDRYVIAGMKEHDSNLGGEQSGHIVFSEYSTTGDGLLAGLQMLAVMQDKRQSLSQCAKAYTPYPQLLTNIKIAPNTDPMEATNVKQEIAKAQQDIGDAGRIYIRKSGTEPLLRVMVEGKDDVQVRTLSASIERAIKKAL
jgi:phosphoglucosamine mutase